MAYEECKFCHITHWFDDGECNCEEYCGKIPIETSDDDLKGAYTRKRFPYYDWILERHIESPQHKREVLKEKNLVQHDGFWGNKREKRGVTYSFGSKHRTRG